MTLPRLFILLTLGLLMACGSETIKETATAEAKASFASYRKDHSYFSRESFEWYLITPDHTKLYILEAGKGKTIVTLHGGFGMEHSYMRTMLKSYEENYHMVYYDQRGSIRSPVPENDFDEYITIDNMVEDLELLRKELGEEKLTLIAHSMGAFLTYEYMRKYPDHVEDVIIVSGFTPKFPSTKAEFHDMFTSQVEREEFKNRDEVVQAREQLKASMNTESRAYKYLDWKIQYAACQYYNLDNWQIAEGGLGLFNGELNDLIGPESNISWIYMYYFWKYQRQFDNGELDATDTEEVTESPINYLAEIKNHPKKITYLLGRYEVGDWNLRLYERTLGQVDNVEMHIFEKAGHMIWIDEPEAFHKVLSSTLENMNPTDQLVQTNF